MFDGKDFVVAGQKGAIFGCQFFFVFDLLVYVENKNVLKTFVNLRHLPISPLPMIQDLLSHSD